VALQDVKWLAKEVDKNKVSTLVVGATPWKLADLGEGKAEPQLFDCVIIDEGSQMLVGDASLPIRLLKQTGRLIVAGDHKQLPPITMGGSYPAPRNGEPVLCRSILDCLMRHTSARVELSPFAQPAAGERVSFQAQREQPHEQAALGADAVHVWVGLRAEGVRALAAALKRNATLTRLDLLSTKVGAEGRRAVARGGPRHEHNAQGADPQ
jgi:hypothetical protein